MIYQPNENVIIMEYVSYIRQMISADSKAKAVKTRSKRKRLYLPLNEDDVNRLICNKSLIDEVRTQSRKFYSFLDTNPINRLNFGLTGSVN